jgi:DNA-binding MarR family transcriptional regulator
MTDKSIAQDAAALSQAFSELIRLVQFRDRDRACCYGLTVSQCYGLKAVCETGPLSVNDLAGALYLEKSTASRLARNLEDAGLVERTTDAEDLRSIRLSASQAGERTPAGIEAELRSEYAFLLEDFEPDVRSAMTELLGRLTRPVGSRVETEGGSCCVVR